MEIEQVRQEWDLKQDAQPDTAPGIQSRDTPTRCRDVVTDSDAVWEWDSAAAEDGIGVTLTQDTVRVSPLQLHTRRL